MMRPDAKVEKVYLYPKPVDFRKSIDGLAALVEAELELSLFSDTLFVFANRQRSRIKILYWHRNGFCLWQKRLEKERFAWPAPGSAMTLRVSKKELEWLLEGFDLWANYPHKTLNYQSVM